MRYMNNNKSEKPKLFRSNKKLWQRILSFITVFALVINTMYSGGLFGLFNFSTVMTVRAEEEPPAYSPTNSVDHFSGTAFSFDYSAEGVREFIDYCYYYSVNEGGTFCGDHSGDTLSITFPEIADNLGFMGLGNATTPFAGSVRFVASNGRGNITLPRALFNHVSTDARITDNSGNNITLEITKNSTASSPILADYVHPGTNASDWSIEVASGNTNAFAGAIGQIETDANVVLSFNNASSATVSNTASGASDIKDVGELCGIMKTGSSLTVTDTSTSRPAVSSSNGNAGSLVGKMEGTASLTLNSGYPGFSGVSVTSEKGYAGGLVGEMISTAAINGLSTPEAIGGSVTGTTGAGGLYGHYTNSAAEFDLKDYNITTAVYAENCGGVFGVLENNASSLTIKKTGNTGSVSVSSGSASTYAATGYFGGIAGKYSTGALTDSLILDSFSLTAASNASFASFGGAIGLVDSAAYIKADGMSITATGTSKRDAADYFGGLVGKTSASKGVFIDLGNFTLSADNSGLKGGGVAGNFKNGVLRLSGITNMSGAKSQKGGQLVGVNDNVLVYALGTGSNGTAYETGWSFKRSNGSQVDDLGTWGEVVRIADIEDTTNGVLTLDSTNHTVTVKGAQTSMGTQTDLVKTALNIQLNQGSNYDCLKFTSGNANTRSTLLGTTLALTANLSFANTGITGFMRDGSDSVGVFSGTLNGNSHTITLATGQAYGLTGSGGAVSSSSEGVGQIYTHKLNGLFSVLGNTTENSSATVSSLKIAGAIDVHNKVDSMNIGGIAAKNGGNVTLSGVTVGDSTDTMTINYNEITNVSSSADTGKNVGGFIGFVGTDGVIGIQGVSSVGATINLSGSHQNYNNFGGAIGNITASKFTINAGELVDSNNKLTINATVGISGVTAVGDDSNSGGLIGRIKDTGSYGNRKVNVNNVDFNGFTFANASNKNGGGILGYSWLNTTANIKGLTVTDATINNCTTSGTAGGNTDIGAMCYVATGRWTVDDLTVTKLTMEDGAGASLGMLVNMAYYGDKGLYLDVLNSGYTLTDKSGSTGITLPDSLDVYDELAAYSALDVVKGTHSVTSGDKTITHGAGVVSINMNAGRHNPDADPADSYTEAKISVTGTYQNQLTSASSDSLGNTAYANENTRYYYNLDVLGNTDAGQNILLWSVNKYAASNINGLFVSSVSNNTLSGAANMTGLSFYPIEGKEDYTISGLTLTMDYSGAYAAESVFGTYNPTDGYTRDPAEANQHYLMHSGLFLSLSNTKTLTISGSNTLKGSFLELSDVSGVLISGTCNGSIVSSNGSTLVLDGIIAKTTGNTAHSTGYLLVNNITRVTSIDSADDITIRLEGISTTDTYSSGATVAKSLLGAASGENLNIEFTKIKLDSRESGTLSGNTALDNAYGTTHSIFTDSTLLASISTDDRAQLKYYYTITEDWGSTGTNGTRWVTYGKEIKDSVEYRDNNGSLENKYDGSTYYTHPTTYQSGSAYDFSTGFLPYVAEPFTAAQTNALYYRELKVNVSAEGLTRGCGTYNDPYVITDGKQLTAVSRFISTGTTDELSKVNLPKAKANYDSIGENTSGARWCTDKTGDGFHLQFTPNSAGTGYENGSITWNAVNVQYYLANAYYKISDNIELSGDSSTGFVGLGGTSANTAFRGVIVGDKNQDGTPKYSITNNSGNPFIKVSNGSVIKDVNVLVNAGTITLTQSAAAYNNAYFGYDSKCQYYGGIIGEIMGGDNIIDNSYVKYSYTDSNKVAHATTITLTDNNSSNSKFGTIVPVGGYVGVVVFGGLIFKNMTATNTTRDNTGLVVYYKNNTTNNLASNTVAAKAAIYVNPIVGRVINAYAVNETETNAEKGTTGRFSVTENNTYHDDANSGAGTARTGNVHTLKNGKKHYTIADINKSETNKLSFGIAGNNNSVTNIVPADASTDGTINIPNAQAFFILSLITQSCAGTAQTANGNYNTSLSYGIYSTKEYGESSNTDHVYGMSHNADYSDVGKATRDTDYGYASADTAAKTAVPYIIRWYTAANSNNYPARCVTSTKGYYDINLTAKTTYSVDSYTYQLPDSFRGLGSVGNYDFENTLLSNKFCMKVDVFNGNNCTIDEDIYLNKFKADNYFDTLHKGNNQVLNGDNNKTTYSANTNTDNHGIGLFNSIISKDETGEIGHFILTGSVNTEIYSNTYKNSGQEEVFVGNVKTSIWLSVGGVVGWSRGYKGNNASYQQSLSFNKIALNNLILSGDDLVGGLLAYSGLQSKTKKVIIKECSSNNISVKMSSANTADDAPKARNAIGCFVGKVQEGAVIIYGTSQMTNNSEITKFSTVTIGSYGFGNSNLDYRVAAGGLVGYAGNGCQAYDMKISSCNSAVTIGLNSGTSYVGGIVGAMQPSTDGDTDCLAVFKNCTIENINIAGQYAGGLYGGKWEFNNYNPYKIEIINCSLIGNSAANNTITARTYAGGFIAWAFVQTRNGDDYNIRIVDSKVSNYTISSAKDGYSGGFIGYCRAKNNSITCYIHDSSVENCIIGQSGSVDYAGGIIGGVMKHEDNNILGYNIKLDNVSSPSTDRKGTWIGFVDLNDKNTSIQFSGMAVYGEKYNFTQNVGNRSDFSNASFVFADYSGASKNFITTTTNSSFAAKQEGDESSETEVFTADSTAKTVSRAVTIVSVGDTETTTETQTTVYPYISVSTADPVSNTSLTENSSVWAVHEDAGTITYTVSDASAQTVTVTTYKLAVSDYNSDDNVVMPKYPYVNVNPQSDMGTDKIISGDGAVLAGSASDTAAYSGKTAESTMALKIYEDLTAASSSPNYSRRYTTFKAYNDADTGKIFNNNKIDYYLKRSTDEDGDRISTYQAEKGELPYGVDNFAVVVIANNETTETTNLINRYIQLVTNTSTDYTDASDYYSIDVKNCNYVGGKFVTDNTAPGLTWTAPDGDDKGTFALNGASADSKRENTFTLVDVQFKDPFNTDNIAYHLYIPVYTIKEIEVSFSAAVMNGTNSVSYAGGVESSNPYSSKLAVSARDTHVDNLNTWYTTYIRYTYSHDDIVGMLDSGNLNWNHDKYFYIDKNALGATSMLTTDTYMILVDPNGDHDKKYQVSLNSTDFAVDNNRIVFDLRKFKDSNNTAFRVSTFNELIAQKITATPNGSNEGKYDLYSGTPSNTGDTHYVYTKSANGTPTYYQYVGSGGGYDLSLPAGDIYENYYISMFVPGDEDDDSLYGYYIRTPENFEAPNYESGTNNAITKSAKINCVYVGSNETNTNTVNRQVYIGNLFEQSTELTVLPNDLEIDNGNHILNIYAKTTITPKDANVITILNSVNADLYHSFNVFLDRKGENGLTTNNISGLDPETDATDIQAWYRIGTAIPTGDEANMNDTGIVSINAANIDLEDNYINVVTVDGGQTILQSGGVTIYSRIRLDFDDYASEFPQKVANDTGVSVRAASNLAYDSTSLAFSNMSEPLEEPSATKHIYYRQSYSSASMKYYAESDLDCYDEDGSPSENYSKIGVSGKYSMNTYMPIDTTAQYNVQNIENALPDADSLILTLSLQKKTDYPTGGPYTSANYQNVSPISNYWGAVQRDGSYEVAPNASGAPVTDSGTNLHISCGSYDDLVTVPANAETFTMTIPKEATGVSGYTVDENGYIYIHVSFNAKTGAGFTEYANYKVNISAKLSNTSSGDISGSYADDYLIYTNAKVNHDFLRGN